MKVIPPFVIPEEVSYKYLLESGFSPDFSALHKFYFNLLRPIVPLSIRQLIQEKFYKNIQYNPGFINDELVNYIKNTVDFDIQIKNLYPDQYKCVIVITHDVEDYAGFNFIENVIELETKYGFRSSWNIVPYKYKIDKGIIKFIRDSGNEIGIHGYNHDGKLYYSEKIFNERVPHINRALNEYNAVGFRSPMVHRNLNWLQKLEIEYDASCFDYDQFQTFPGGTGSIWPFIAGKFVELPYTLPQDHTIFYVLKEKNISMWKNKAKWIAENNGMILVLTHPDYLINPLHLSMYENLLIYLKSINSAWHCLPAEITTWWNKKFRSSDNIYSHKNSFSVK